MIGLLIFSKDRAAQLDFLLSSIEKFCPNEFEINLIYKTSNQAYQLAYEEADIFDRCEFIYEDNDLAKQTKNVLDRYKYCAVSTDDTVIYRPFEFVEEYMAGVDIFSLRYGLNTIQQDPFSHSIQPALSHYIDEVGTISWDSRDYHPILNYGFLFGHDMHVYSRRYLELIQNFNFKKINELESWLYNNCRDRINPFIRSFKESVAVNIPGNNQSGITETDNSLPIEEINQRFLDGERFRFDELLSTKIVGSHQTVGLVMQ